MKIMEKSQRQKPLKVQSLCMFSGSLEDQSSENNMFIEDVPVYE